MQMVGSIIGQQIPLPIDPTVSFKALFSSKAEQMGDHKLETLL